MASNIISNTPQIIQTNNPLAIAGLVEAALFDFEPGHTIIRLCQPTPLTPRQALTIGALACLSLLTGEPKAFDPADLALAVPMLRRMAKAVR